MALPSVRVLKIQWNESCISSCEKTDFDTDKNCEKGKIIMSLNFTPVSYITTKIYTATSQNFAITSKREKIFYHKIYYPSIKILFGNHQKLHLSYIHNIYFTV